MLLQLNMNFKHYIAIKQYTKSSKTQQTFIFLHKYIYKKYYNYSTH